MTKSFHLIVSTHSPFSNQRYLVLKCKASFAITSSPRGALSIEFSSAVQNSFIQKISVEESITHLDIKGIQQPILRNNYVISLSSRIASIRHNNQ